MTPSQDLLALRMTPILNHCHTGRGLTFSAPTGPYLSDNTLTLWKSIGSTANCGSITSYKWKLGDVELSSSATFIYTVELETNQTDSTFALKLVITNTVGRKDSTTRTVTVRDYQGQYYVKDHLGSPRVTVDGKGNVLSYADYYPFGSIMPGRSGNNGMSHDRTKFTGYLLEEEGEQDTYHAEARGYDPVIGRFTSRDPLSNLYPSVTPFAYAMNNPILLVDRTGLCPESSTDPEEGVVDGGCLPEGEVTASRDGASSGFSIEIDGWEKRGNRIYFDASNPKGAEHLYSHLRDNHSQACSMVGGSGFSDAAKSIAMRACIHGGQAAFLRGSLEFGADLASIVSLASGVGTLAGGAAILLRTRSAIQLTKTISGVGLKASGTEAGLRMAAVPVGGSQNKAIESSINFGLSFGIGKVALSATGIGSTSLNTGPAFRNVATGKFVTNNVGYNLWGAATITGTILPIIIP